MKRIKKWTTSVLGTELPLQITFPGISKERLESAFLAKTETVFCRGNFLLFVFALSFIDLLGITFCKI